jgi:hypothetical protein
VDKIDNELQLVQAFEVRKFSRITGADEGVKPARMSALVPLQSTACSPKRSVSVSSLKVVSKTPARVQPIPFASCVGYHPDQPQPAPARHDHAQIPGAHHRSEPFRCDYDHIDIFARNNRPIINRETMREEAESDPDAGWTRFVSGKWPASAYLKAPEK